MSTACIIPGIVKGQAIETTLLLESRSGYTSNMLLNPLLAEWERSENSAYLSTLAMGQAAAVTGRFSGDVSGGFIHSPFLNRDETWTGGFGLLSGRFRLGNYFSAGAEGGYSRFSTVRNREFRWIQPVLTWSPAYNTQFRFKAGPFYRKTGIGEDETEEFSERVSFYSVEAEYWPGFRWQFRGSVNGNLEAPTESVGFRTSAAYLINSSARISFNAGLDRFGYQVPVQNGGGGGGGFPPIGNTTGNGEILEEADYLIRAGSEAVYRFHRNAKLSLRGDFLRYNSTAGAESFNDLHTSVGVRVNFSPTTRSRGRADIDWRQNDTQTVILNLRYRGDGDLYLIGDFNDWQEPGIPLSHAGSNRYAAQVDLSPGAYEYKVLLIEDGEESWIELSDDTYTVSDGFGGYNGLIFID
ncbi:MAG: glycogen-binding domain-containing protein [Balneolaceae bacterium]|nr:glycogen-binding domain-containing protein [Balneolaceae bacterium]MCH8549613.1 glycogen-binding domain-containing protein [Balneolaceae bacterium]